MINKCIQHRNLRQWLSYCGLADTPQVSQLSCNAQFDAPNVSYFMLESELGQLSPPPKVNKDS